MSRVIGRTWASSGSERVGTRPGEVIDRNKAFSFSWEGGTYRGVRGRHDRLGTRRLGSPSVLAQLQVPPASGHPQRELS